jgi:hypothetical protein
MAKGHLKNRQLEQLKHKRPVLPATNELDLGQTLVPDEQPTTINNYWMANSTNVPGVDVGENEEQPFAANWSEFTEKGLRGKIQIAPSTVFMALILVWVGFVGWLFVNDNELGRLDSVVGINWFIYKMGILSVFFLIGFLLLFIYSLIAGRFNRSKAKEK